MQAGCIACDPDGYAVTGRCVPGTYIITYRVTNDAGLSVSATRNITVYQSGTITASFLLYKDMTNGTAATELKDNLKNIRSVDYGKAVIAIRAALGSNGSSIPSSDIAILDAAVIQQAVQNYSINVTAAITIYIPSSLHGPALNATTKSSARRHLLSSIDMSGQAMPAGAVSALASQPHLFDDISSMHARHLLQSSITSPVISLMNNFGLSLSASLAAVGVTTQSLTAADIDLKQVRCWHSCRAS